MAQWRKTSAHECWVMFLCPCPAAEEIWCSPVQAELVSPPAQAAAALLALAARRDFGSLRELEDREEPNGSRMEVLKKVGTEPSQNSHLRILFGTSLLCLSAWCDLPKSRLPAQLRSQGSCHFPSCLPALLKATLYGEVNWQIACLLLI